jgi:2-amino-4-hydroxy-6-hydroxymethyldihydropteridine diphosphokinase
LSFEAKAVTKATVKNKQISEKITSDKREAKNILKKLLMVFLYVFKSRRFITRIFSNYTNRLFPGFTSYIVRVRILIKLLRNLCNSFNSVMVMNEAYLLTGGNIGVRSDYLARAKEAIKKKCGDVLQVSSIYETAAWGMENQEAFLNQVLEIETNLNPDELLQSILQIEEGLGRKRELKYGPRTIDIDILFFNDQVIDQEGLKIPHPQLQNRRFVLVPLDEIASNKIHPIFKKTISQLLAECPDPLTVNKFN